MNAKMLNEYLNGFQSRGIPGCHLTIMIDHEPVYSHMAGVARPGEPMRGDETYWFYSATKLVTMTALTQLIERGIVRLDDPVYRYLPAYEKMSVREGDTTRPARNVITIEHLMTMQSGMSYNLQAPSIQAALKENRSSTVELVNAMAAEPLSFEPGSRFLYSLSHDVAAAVVEVVSGKRFGAYVQENIFDPLGMTDITFHPTEDQRARMATRWCWDAEEKPFEQDNSDNPYVLSDRYESGGAGLVGSVDSYILIVDALANGGVGRTGHRILAPGSIDMMRTARLSGRSLADYQSLGRVGYSYGLGVRTMVDNSEARSPVGEFGWDGAAGAWLLIDPEHHLAAFYAQHVLGCSRVFHEIHPELRDKVYEALEF